MVIRLELFVRKYWLELLFFAALSIYYIMGISPSVTWVGLGGDAADYVVGTTNFWAVRPTGYPTFVILGWLFQRLPMDPFWNLGLLGALAAIGTCLFIFLTIKRFTNNRLAPYIGTLVYSASFLVWTQSGLPDSVYSLNTLFMVAGVYFALRNKWYTSAAVFALGVGVHHTMVFSLFPIIGYLFLKKYKWRETNASILKFIGIVFLGFLAYLQALLCVHGQETTSGQTSFTGQTMGSIGFVFGLPLTETWSRIKDFVPIILTGLGTGLVLLPFLKRSREIILLVICMLGPIAYYFFSNMPTWGRYMIPGFAFCAILIGIGASRFPYKRILYIFPVVSIIFMGVNFQFWDVGRTMDPSPTAASRYIKYLDTVPNGSLVYMANWGEPWVETYYYLTEHNDRFWEISESQLRYFTEAYSKYKESQGLRMPSNYSIYGKLYKDTTYFDTWNQSMFLEDFSKLNPNVSIFIMERVGKTFTNEEFQYKEYIP